MWRNYNHKFALPSGKIVYVPSQTARRDGANIVRWTRRRWHPPSWYYHFQRGGHVAALRAHMNSTRFLRLDIDHFFDHVTRTKIHRALRQVGFSHADALDFARRSTVEKTKGRSNFSLPYGFVQSTFLASLVLDKSGLGRYLRDLVASGTRVSVYVDDILFRRQTRPWTSNK